MQGLEYYKTHQQNHPKYKQKHPKSTPKPAKVTSWAAWCPLGRACFSKTSIFDDSGFILGSILDLLGPPWETFFSPWSLRCRFLFTLCLLFY